MCHKNGRHIDPPSFLCFLLLLFDACTDLRDGCTCTTIPTSENVQVEGGKTAGEEDEYCALSSVSGEAVERDVMEIGQTPNAVYLL